MSKSRRDSRPTTAPHQIVGKAIQDLIAARLGRGFVPLGILAALGVAQLVSAAGAASGALALLAGAPLAGVAMLGYGLRVVQNAFGRKQAPWMAGAMAASVVPPAFAVYVIGWRGLRALSGGGSALEFFPAILFIGLGVWVLRSWMKVVEVERLARVMASNMDEYGGPA